MAKQMEFHTGLSWVTVGQSIVGSTEEERTVKVSDQIVVKEDNLVPAHTFQTAEGTFKVGTYVLTKSVSNTFDITATYEDGTTATEQEAVSDEATVDAIVFDTLGLTIHFDSTEDLSSMADATIRFDEEKKATLYDDTIIPGTGALTIPVGTTEQRPANPKIGMVRINTDL